MRISSLLRKKDYGGISWFLSSKWISRTSITFHPIYISVWNTSETICFNFILLYPARWAREIIFEKFEQEIVHNARKRVFSHTKTAEVVDIVDSSRLRRSSSTYENYNFPDSAKVSWALRENVCALHPSGYSLGLSY